MVKSDHGCDLLAGQKGMERTSEGIPFAEPKSELASEEPMRNGSYGADICREASLLSCRSEHTQQQPVVFLKHVDFNLFGKAPIHTDRLQRTIPLEKPDVKVLKNSTGSTMFEPKYVISSLLSDVKVEETEDDDILPTDAQQEIRTQSSNVLNNSVVLLERLDPELVRSHLRALEPAANSSRVVTSSQLKLEENSNVRQDCDCNQDRGNHGISQPVLDIPKTSTDQQQTQSNSRTLNKSAATNEKRQHHHTYPYVPPRKNFARMQTQWTTNANARVKKRKIRSKIQQAHSEDRPYSCVQCLLKFKARFALQSHVRNVHSTDQLFPCDRSRSKFSVFFDLLHFSSNNKSVGGMPDKTSRQFEDAVLYTPYKELSSSRADSFRYFINVASKTNLREITPYRYSVKNYRHNGLENNESFHKSRSKTIRN